MLIRKVYEPFERTDGLSFEGTESMTKPSFQDEVDINSIVRRFAKTGVLPELIKENPQYGDFSEAPEYKEALEIVKHAEEQFMALSAEVRERFGNDPEKFLGFAHDPSNLKEMGELDLLTPEAKQRIQNESKAIEEQNLNAEIQRRTAALKPPEGTPKSP